MTAFEMDFMQTKVWGAFLDQNKREKTNFLALKRVNNTAMSRKDAQI
jgi:hypothetical protein